MSSSTPRWLILIGVLALGNWLLAALDAPRAVSAARWPTEEALYAVDTWSVGPAAVESQHGVDFISRSYRQPDGSSATLVVATSPEAKRVYRAGPDIPFLGSGYTIDQAPPSLVPSAPGHGAMVVQREHERWLLLYTYGERRGPVGNGVLGWGLVVFDAVLGHANNYFLASVLVPLDRLDSPRAREAVLLADTLFARLAAWYAT